MEREPRSTSAQIGEPLTQTTHSLPFTVDSALLRELGERLVGRHHIAVAELIKNAYDADATCCNATISHDRIDVADNGHGMTFDEFQAYWMRIGP